MALFSKKKSDETADPSDGAKDAAAFEPQPDKARKWFEHGRAAAETYNYEYALNCYAHGIKLDPTAMSAHEGMFDAAVQYASAGGKAAAGKEVRKLDGSHPVDKFAAAEYAWLKDLNNLSLALKFLESSIKALEWGGEAGRWHCPRILNVLRHQKKASKSTFLAAKDIFPQLGAWDEALCDLFRVPQAILPEVRDCAADFGAADPALFGGPIQIAGIAGDQQAAVVG